MGRPLTGLGACSNVIVRDGGIEGVVVRLARGFSDIEVQTDGLVVGAAALDVTVAEHSAAAGLAGLEFLVGIPGSIGGAVRMNAGASVPTSMPFSTGRIFSRQMASCVASPVKNWALRTVIRTCRKALLSSGPDCVAHRTRQT